MKKETDIEKEGNIKSIMNIMNIMNIEIIKFYFV